MLIEEDYIPEFTAHINNIDPNIQFTNEPEVEGSIPFLDVKIYIQEDGSTRTTVYLLLTMRMDVYEKYLI